MTAEETVAAYLKVLCGMSGVTEEDSKSCRQVGLQNVAHEVKEVASPCSSLQTWYQLKKTFNAHYKKRQKYRSVRSACLSVPVTTFQQNKHFHDIWHECDTNTRDVIWFLGLHRLTLWSSGVCRSWLHVPPKRWQPPTPRHNPKR